MTLGASPVLNSAESDDSSFYSPRKFQGRRKWPITRKKRDFLFWFSLIPFIGPDVILENDVTRVNVYHRKGIADVTRVALWGVGAIFRGAGLVNIDRRRSRRVPCPHIVIWTYLSLCSNSSQICSVCLTLQGRVFIHGPWFHHDGIGLYGPSLNQQSCINIKLQPHITIPPTVYFTQCGQSCTCLCFCGWVADIPSCLHFAYTMTFTVEYLVVRRFTMNKCLVVRIYRLHCITDASQIPYSGGVLGMPHWEEPQRKDPGHARVTVTWLAWERLGILLEELEASVQRGKPGCPFSDCLPHDPLSDEWKMDGWTGLKCNDIHTHSKIETANTVLQMVMKFSVWAPDMTIITMFPLFYHQAPLNLEKSRLWISALLSFWGSFDYTHINTCILSSIKMWRTSGSHSLAFSTKLENVLSRKQ